MRAYFHLPYRQTEGVVISHASTKVPGIPHYSTISRRINKLEIKINEKLGNDIVIALDSSTGIKVANRGEWMQHKWHVRKKGYLKIHVAAVDIKKKKRIASLEITSEEVHHDGKMLNKLVDNAAEDNRVKCVLADGMYDSNNRNFRYLSKSHIKPGIKTRSNSKVKTTTNCHARNMSVVRQQQQQTNLKRWKHSVSYGHRWMTETVFSSMKRMFGEHVSARKFPNMVKEIFIKASLYNRFNQIV
jgi:hypothetical protein